MEIQEFLNTEIETEEQLFALLSEMTKEQLLTIAYAFVDKVDHNLEEIKTD